jgi:hypothetical protein
MRKGALPDVGECLPDTLPRFDRSAAACVQQSSEGIASLCRLRAVPLRSGNARAPPEWGSSPARENSCIRRRNHEAREEPLDEQIKNCCHELAAGARDPGAVSPGAVSPGAVFPGAVSPLLAPVAACQPGGSRRSCSCRSSGSLRGCAGQRRAGRRASSTSACSRSIPGSIVTPCASGVRRPGSASGGDPRGQCSAGGRGGGAPARR